MDVSYHYDYNVPLVPQDSTMTCWAAVGSMLLGNQSPGMDGVQTNPDGSLGPDATNVHKFADDNNFRFWYPQSWTEDMFYRILSNGPIGLLGQIPDLHCVVIAGMWNDDGYPVLHVLDPWPVGSGDDYKIELSQFLDTYPCSTMYALQAS